MVHHAIIPAHSQVHPFSSDVVDPHIPEERVQQSAEVLQRLGGNVTARLYPRMGHTVNRDELRFVQTMMAGLT